MCEEYNGWTNRETWAMNLWLENDHGMYDMLREHLTEARKYLAEEDGTFDGFYAGAVIQDRVDELLDPEVGLLSSVAIIDWLKDVGSLYRIDWTEIGQAWLNGLDD